MNNEQYNQIIDEAYENYLNGGDVKWLKQVEIDTPVGKMNIPIPYSKEEFINKCKTDEKFSDKWGLKIEERELSLEERLDIWTSLLNDRGYDENTLNDPERAHIWLDTARLDMGPIPRRVTTVTYKDRTIESYE